MNHHCSSSERIHFIEQVHQEFLYLKGYGTYAYVTCKEVDHLFDAYQAHHHSIRSCMTHSPPEVAFIRSFIKSLPSPVTVASSRGMENYQDL